MMASCGVVGLLARPQKPLELANAVRQLEPSTVIALLALLRNADVVQLCTSEGRVTEEETGPLRHWAFHDLLFHARSRRGRHDNPIGATFPFKDEPPPPAITRPVSQRSINLSKPNIENLRLHDSSFTEVLEARRSWRGKSRAAYRHRTTQRIPVPGRARSASSSSRAWTGTQIW